MLLFLAFLEEEENKELEQLYWQYRGPLFRIAKSILNDHHLAEDALQIMFIKLAAYLKKKKLPAEEKLRPFLVAIIKHTAIDLYRKQQRAPELMEISEEIFPAPGGLSVLTPEEILLNEEAYQRLVAYIKEMPLIHQEILLFRYYYEMTEQEISDLLEKAIF